MISYSSDLITWTAPEGEGLLSNDSTKGVTVESQPRNNNGGGFDIVAPEWFLDSDNNVYIIVSCGYYGAFHGNPTVDQMDPYIIKVDQLSATGIASDGPAGTNYKWPQGLVFKASPAKKMTSVMNATGGADYIDGSITKDGGTYYLYYKRDGVYIDVYSTTDLMADNWTCEGKGLGSTSYEGPCTIKFNNQYMLYADQVVGASACGVKRSVSTSPKSNFSSFGSINFWANTNAVREVARHGTLMVVKPGTPEYTAVKNAMTTTGTTFDLPTEVPVYRLYNEATSEHLYTGGFDEYNYYSCLYDQRLDCWKPEGTGWYAPKDGKYVYRLYNAGLGLAGRNSHYYTADKVWAETLEKEQGWKIEGSVCYSGGTKPIYHAYSEALRSAHFYTTSIDEYRGLDGGWNKEPGTNGFKDEAEIQTGLGTGIFKCVR